MILNFIVRCMFGSILILLIVWLWILIILSIKFGLTENRDLKQKIKEKFCEIKN